MPLALVTGAAKRIGASIALALAQAGFDIALHVNTSKDEGKATIEKLRQVGANANIFSLDLSQIEQIKPMITTIVNTMGPVDLVINNASIFAYDTPESYDVQIARRQMEINLLAPVEIVRNFADNCTDQALVINMLDNKLFALNPDYFSYTMSKAALQSATIMMAMSYAGKIRINAIAPGVTLPSGNQSEENFKLSQRKSLSGMSATPVDISTTVLHLWNTKSINGETIVLDGGQRYMGLVRDVAFL